MTTAQASRDRGVLPNLLRLWLKAYEADSAHAFPGHGRMKPEQLEVDRLRREVAKLKAERDIQKNGVRRIRLTYSAKDQA